MLLLLLELDIPWVPVRDLVILLRSVIDVGLRLVLSTFVIDLWLEHSFVLVRRPTLKGKFLIRLNRSLPQIVEVEELPVDRQDLVVVEAVRLPIDQTLDRGQLLKDKDVLVFLVEVDVAEIGVEQVVVHLRVDAVRRLQIHDRAENLEEILSDLVSLLRHDIALVVTKDEVVSLLPEHDAEAGLLVVHDPLVYEAHILQDILDVEAASLVDVVLDDVLVLSVHLHDQVVVGVEAGDWSCWLRTRTHGAGRRLAVVQLSLFDARVLPKMLRPILLVASTPATRIAARP